MSRREAIRLAGMGGLMAVMPAARAAMGGASPVRRPNILMLVADDQQAETIGALGKSPVFTPHLDSLVKEGTLFAAACNMGSTCGPVCIPARAMLLTGRPIYQLQGKGYDIPSGHQMLPEYLRSQGYATFGCGKWHNDYGAFTRAFSRGDRIFLGGMLEDQTCVPVHHLQPDGKLISDGTINRYSSELFADAAVDFLGSYREEAPFFCYAAFTSPHDPRTPPPEFKALYPADKMQVPASFQSEHPFDIGVREIRDETILPYPRTPERVREEISAYYGMISHMDSQVGRILKALKDAGHENDTIVIYTADHGLALGQHGLMGKQNVYQCSVGIPLVMRGPGMAAGARADALCYSMDLFPTLCDLLGLKIPSSVQGRSYSGVLNGKTAVHRDQLFYAYTEGQKAVRDSRYKLIEYNFADRPQVSLLYDLQEDPDETRNLAEDSGHAKLLADMRSRLGQWPEAVGKPV